MDTPGVIKFKEIVADFLLDIGDENQEKFSWALNLALRCYTDLNLYYLRGVSSTTLTISDNGVCELPPDYIDYTAIGVYNNGTLEMLTRKTDMYPAQDGACAERDNDSPPSADDNEYMFVTGQYVNAWYGKPGGDTRKYFDLHIDTNGSKFIQFGGDLAPGSEVLVEYISSGVGVDKETFVPAQAKEAILAYLDWKHEWRFGSKNASQVARSVYKEELRKLNSFENSVTAQELIDVFMHDRRQTISRV